MLPASSGSSRPKPSSTTAWTTYGATLRWLRVSKLELLLAAAPPNRPRSPDQIRSGPVRDWAFELALALGQFVRNLRFGASPRYPSHGCRGPGDGEGEEEFEVTIQLPLETVGEWLFKQLYRLACWGNFPESSTGGHPRQGPGTGHIRNPRHVVQSQSCRSTSRKP